MNNASIVTIPFFFSINIVLKGQYIELQLLLFFVLAFADVIDGFARFRVEKERQNFQSKLWRAGLSQKINDYISVGVISIILYASLGVIRQPNLWITTLISSIPLVLTTGYIIGSLSSILENNIEYYKEKGIQPQPTTLFLVKFLGLAQGKLFKTLLKKVDDEGSIK